MSDLRQRVLDALPRKMALPIYLLRNTPYKAIGEVYEDVSMQLFVPKRNKLWIDRIESGEGHEQGICKFINKHIKGKKSYVYCDVGSCFGFFPAFITEINPLLQIHAFEGGWQQFYFLKRNAELYADKNKWQIINKMVGSETEEQFVSLDDYFGAADNYPNLIQIDVDGYENEVLLGCKKIIAHGKSSFLLELHPLILHHFNTSVSEVLNHFDNYEISILPNIREGNSVWEKDLDLIYKDDNPYLFITPKTTEF